MNMLYLFFSFIFGACLGSFLNVVAHRLHAGESFIRGRSHCPHCRRTLAWHDLIPLVSWVRLKGKCRLCHQPISRQYPAVELAAGLLLALGVWHFGWSPDFLLYTVVSGFFLVLFVFDARFYLIPDRVSLPAIIIVFGLNLLLGKSLGNLLAGAVLGGGWFLAQFLISRGRWVGGGDIRLGVLMGVLLGYPLVFLALLIAYVGGSALAIGLVLAGRARLNGRLPFATILLPATFVTYLWGSNIWVWYLGLLGL